MDPLAGFSKAVPAVLIRPVSRHYGSRRQGDRARRDGRFRPSTAATDQKGRHGQQNDQPRGVHHTASDKRSSRTTCTSFPRHGLDLGLHGLGLAVRHGPPVLAEVQCEAMNPPVHGGVGTGRFPRYGHPDGSDGAQAAKSPKYLRQYGKSGHLRILRRKLRQCRKNEVDDGSGIKHPVRLLSV